jgi:altronate hydrolase
MKTQKKKTIQLHPKDNVVVALIELAAETTIDDSKVCSRESIPAGHKIATRRIRPREPIIKYGQIIGFASKNILEGEHVHTHNVELMDFKRDYEIIEDTRPTFLLPEKDQAVFEGIVRSDGRVGTRNYIGILATVSCSVSVALLIAEAAKNDISAEYTGVDGIIAFGHGEGCCMTQGGEGLLLLQRTMAGYARHPNFAGILLVGLGCEVNRIHGFMEEMHLKEGPLLRTVNIQDAGGTRETVHLGVQAVKEMLPDINRVKRQKVSVGHLILGLECGASDAYSGITANPALGKAVDLLVENGGTAILSETPEIYGAEHLLIRRAVNRSVGKKLIERIHWWEEYTARENSEINNNPTPGNKAGGLTTILEKSLGAVAKGGTSVLKEVYGYAEPVVTKGLVFMDTPGYDVVSITGMIAGGANVVCFTTGRGTVCDFKPVPTIKLASNSQMYQHMKEDMDVNCGPILEGSTNIDEMGKAIFDLILDTASGRKTKSENFGFGANEFVPWHIGAVM